MKKHWVQGLGVSAFALIMAMPAMAQVAQSSATQAAEDSTVVVVTANKRKERVFDVAQTVNVVTADQVQKLNLTNVEEIQKVTPGLKFDHGAGGRNNVVTLRGVQYNPDAGGNPTVDIYTNEVLVSGQTALQAMYDLSSIQVLRGPQGTLRAGTGPSGALLIGTQMPNLRNVSGYASTSMMGDNNLNAQFGVGVPLIEGKLAVRLAGLYDENDGNGGNSKYYNDPDHSQTTSGRVSVVWKPLENLTFNSTYTGLHSTKTLSPLIMGTGTYGTIEPTDRLNLAKQPTRITFDSEILTFEAAYDFSGNRLTYLGGFQKSTSDLYRDGDYINAAGSNYINLLQLSNPAQVQSSELRFERTGSHFWMYRFGYYYSRSTNGTSGTTANNYKLDGTCSLAKACYLTTIGGGGAVRAEGLFTTQTFNFSPSDILEIGLRQNKTDGDAFTAFTVFGSTTSIPTPVKYNSTTGDINFKHYFSRELMTYVNYGTSFRPGGFDSFGAFQNGFLTPSEDFFSIKPEKSKSLELGVRNEMFEKKLSVTAAVFDQRYENYIYHLDGLFCTKSPNAATGPNADTVYATTTGAAGGPLCQNNSVSITSNANVIVQGVEMELRARITPQWLLNVGAMYNNAHFDDATVYCNDFNGDGVADQNGTPAIQKGKYISTCKTSATLGGLPKWQITLNSEYHYPISGGWDGYVRGLATIRPSFKDTLTGQTSSKSNLVDFFVGATSPKGLEVGLFVKNLLNDQGVNGLGSTSSTYSIITLPQERRLGLQVRQSF